MGFHIDAVVELKAGLELQFFELRNQGEGGSGKPAGETAVAMLVRCLVDDHATMLRGLNVTAQLRSV